MMELIYENGCLKCMYNGIDGRSNCCLSISLGADNLGTVNGGRKVSLKDKNLDVRAGFYEKKKGRTLCYSIEIGNKGDRKVILEDLYVDFPFPDICTNNAENAEQEDYYILHPVKRTYEYGQRILILPYGKTQLDLCETDTAASCYRCYLFAAGRKKEEGCQKRGWKNNSEKLEIGPKETRQWIFLITLTTNEKELTEFMMQYGRVPIDTGDGINGMRTVGHHFFEEPASLEVFREFANTYHCAILKNGRLCSLRNTKGSIEAIDPEEAFGDIQIRRADGIGFSTAGANGFFGDNHALCFYSDGMLITLHFELLGKLLRYNVTLKNCSDKTIVLTDLVLPIPLNSRMGWGTDPAERMIRHSQVAGDNSFFLATPCDGKTPYLLCLPHEGTRWELFDTTENKERRTYQIHIFGEAAAKLAREKEGGRWRLPVSHAKLKPGEQQEYGCDFQWAGSYEEARQLLVAHGKIDIQVVPGLTVPQDQKARLLLKSRYENLSLTAEHPEDTVIELISQENDCRLYQVEFKRLGENLLTIEYDGGKRGWIEMFSTLPVETLLCRRADYICKCQCLEPEKWYDGLFRERNTKSGVMLDPDHYDEIEGWRRYEVTCDDPGLSKPAFLASKNAELPNEEEIKALDYYIEHFVWGGLQRTDAEEYPYGIYGIPDWNELRNRKNYNANELLHIWRLYDYPHIILLYYKMYEIARNHPGLPMMLDATEYLRRAYGTCLAMYQYPFEIEHSYAWSHGYWSPYQTGFYNELVIVDVIAALRREGRPEQAKRLEFHWQHKADYFIRECGDLFGSEYAFDTTGFESTQAIVDWGRKHAGKFYNSDERSLLSYTLSEVESFDLKQRACNIACRGYMENAYYITGSDIRGDSTHYTLGYMSQMGGWALLQDALYSSDSPFELLRLGYNSLLSSWAVLNAGNERSNYGYWFPGKENDGASSGGFEAAPYSITWLGQPSHNGVWIYGCETDLGYCGYLRGAAVIFAQDPWFGEICYGGVVREQAGGLRIQPADGVGRQFHYVRSDTERLHILLYGAHMEEIWVENEGRIVISLNRISAAEAWMHIFTHDVLDNVIVGSRCGTDLEINLSGKKQIEIKYSLRGYDEG